MSKLIVDMDSKLKDLAQQDHVFSSLDELREHSDVHRINRFIRHLIRLLKNQGLLDSDPQFTSYFDDIVEMAAFTNKDAQIIFEQLVFQTAFFLQIASSMGLSEVDSINPAGKDEFAAIDRLGTILIGHKASPVTNRRHIGGFPLHILRPNSMLDATYPRFSFSCDLIPFDIARRLALVYMNEQNQHRRISRRLKMIFAIKDGGANYQREIFYSAVHAALHSINDRRIRAI